MSVRQKVFVEEQRIPMENEFDKNDARAWHWVIYSSPPPPSSSSSSLSSSASPAPKTDHSKKIPVGTLRILPWPHGQLVTHPTHEQETEIAREGKEVEDREEKCGKEPYIKIGRMSVLQDHRGHGFAKRLLDEALGYISQYPDMMNSQTPCVSDVTRREKIDEEGMYDSVMQTCQHDDWNGLVLIHAQKSVEKAWAKMGFVKDETMGEWVEEGIDHVGMWKRIKVSRK